MDGPQTSNVPAAGTLGRSSSGGADATGGGSGLEEPPSRRSSLGTGASGGPGCSLHTDIADPRGLIGPEDARWLGEALHRCVSIALEDLPTGGGDVRVLLVDDIRMQAEHTRTLGDAATTDVLTFDLASGASEHGSDLDVDLLVCVDEACRQASARGHGIREELLLYALHGVLHCLGYDDATPGDAQRMHAREDEVLRAIGVGAVFAGGGAIDAGEGER